MSLQEKQKLEMISRRLDHDCHSFDGLTQEELSDIVIGYRQRSYPDEKLKSKNTFLERAVALSLITDEKIMLDTLLSTIDLREVLLHLKNISFLKKFVRDYNYCYLLTSLADATNNIDDLIELSLTAVSGTLRKAATAKLIKLRKNKIINDRKN